MPKMMKAAIFVEPNRITLDDKPIPDVGPLDVAFHLMMRIGRQRFQQVARAVNLRTGI